MIAEPQSKYQRFELFLWRDCFTLAYNNLGPAPWANEYLLIAYRVLVSLALLSLSLYHLIKNKDPTLFFFTNWGIFLTTISFTLFTALYLRRFLTPQSHMERNRTRFYTPWLLWKWCIFFYETSLTFEILITIFFWSVLFPIMIKTGKTPGIFTYIDHIAPVVVLSIDYCMNRIPFNIRHLPLSLVILIAYGIVNMVKTLVTGVPVYPPLNYHDVMTFVWMAVLLGLEVLAFWCMVKLTKWKLGKVHRIDEKRGSELTVFNISKIDNSSSGPTVLNLSNDISDIQVDKIGCYSKI